MNLKDSEAYKSRIINGQFDFSLKKRTIRICLEYKVEKAIQLENHDTIGVNVASL